MCEEIINATDNVATNFDIKNVRYKMDCYIMNTVLLVIIWLFIITTIFIIMQNIDQN